jgi:hypothetical protein
MTRVREGDHLPPWGTASSRNLEKKRKKKKDEKKDQETLEAEISRSPKSDHKSHDLLSCCFPSAFLASSVEHGTNLIPAEVGVTRRIENTADVLLLNANSSLEWMWRSRYSCTCTPYEYSQVLYSVSVQSIR